jgi:hypothetical protein
VSLLRLLALALLVAVGGHQAVLLPGQAEVHSAGLTATPHTAVWGAAVALVLVMLLLAAAWTAWRLVALRWRLRRVPVMRVPRGAVLLRSWAAIAGLALAAFLLQENWEHFAGHGHLPLLDPLLSGEYATTLPVFSGLGLLVAIASLVLGHRLAELRAATARRAPQRERPIRRISRPVVPADRRLRARMATSLMARRGPPLTVPART